MSLLLKDLLAAGIGYETVNVILEVIPHRAGERWFDLVEMCIATPGILNTITGYEKPSYLGSLFGDDPPKPKNIHPSEQVIIEKIIRWAYEIPIIQPINMSPFMLYQTFPSLGGLRVYHDKTSFGPTVLARINSAHLQLMKHYCKQCHEYVICELINREETIKRSGYTYFLEHDQYLACYNCYPMVFEGLGSLFG